MNRIDALPPDPARLAAFTGDLLAPEEDPVLQALVREAAAATDAPIAAVSLVLQRIQLFRAHHGMPADLAAVQATDREVSFCQLVVRDRAPVVVTEASSDGRVPQDLVQRYGVNAYLGVPLIVGGHALGSLCVIDVRPRQFTPAQLQALEAIGERARARLEVLAGARARTMRARRGLLPAFGEVRNLLMPLENNLASARVNAAELRVLGRLVEHVVTHGVVAAVGSLAGARRALDDLDDALADAADVAAELRDVVLALQLAVLPGEGRIGVAAAVTAALVLAEHETKLIGGVRSRGNLDNLPLRAPGTAAVTLLATALAELARRLRAGGAACGIDLVVRAAPDAMIVELTTPDQGATTLDDTAGLLDELVTDEPAIAVVSVPGGVAVRLMT